MASEPAAVGAQVRKSFLIPNTPGFNGVFKMQALPSPAFPMTPLQHEVNERASPTPIQEDLQKDEYTGLKPPRILRWSRIALVFTRIALSILIVGAGAAIVGCEGHALHTFHATNLGPEWFLPLWPQNLDLRPTITLLAAGAVMLGLNLLYLISACIPYCFRRYFIHNILYLAGAFLSIVAAISATGYSAHIYATTGAGNNSNSRDTIQSWTCRWYDGANAHSTTSAGGIKAPTGFGRLCSESHAAFDITIAAILFELAALALGGVGFWLEKKMRGGGGRDLGQRGGED